MSHYTRSPKELILFRAKKWFLPKGKTRIFEDVQEETQQLVSDAVESLDIGEPVLLCWDGPQRWTVVGCEGVATWDNGESAYCAYAEMKRIRSRGLAKANRSRDLPQEQWQERRSSWEYLTVRDRSDEEHEIWVPADAEAYALLNILEQTAGLKETNFMF